LWKPPQSAADSGEGGQVEFSGGASHEVVKSVLGRGLCREEIKKKKRRSKPSQYGRRPKKTDSQPPWERAGRLR